MGFSLEHEVRVEAAFTTTTDFTNISGTTETPFMLFRNPSGSGLLAMLTHFSGGTNDSGSRTVFRFYMTPTITATGTALGICNTYLKASPTASVMEAYKNPTTSSNGTLMNPLILPADSQSRGLNRLYWVVFYSNSNILCVKGSI